MSNTSAPATAAKGELHRGLQSLLTLVLDQDDCALRRELGQLATSRFRAEVELVLEWDDKSLARELARQHKSFTPMRVKIQSAMARNGNWSKEIEPQLKRLKQEHSLKARWGLIVFPKEPPPQAEPSNILQTEFGALTPYDALMMIKMGIKWDERSISEM